MQYDRIIACSLDRRPPPPNVIPDSVPDTTSDADPNPVLTLVQRAMGLSEAQKRSLRDWRSRVMADSEVARRRRAELWQQLSSRMMGDDRRSMERLAVVRAGFQSRRSRVQPHVARGQLQQLRTDPIGWVRFAPRTSAVFARSSAGAECGSGGRLRA